MKKIFLAFLFFLTILIPSLTNADGGIFYPPDRWMGETMQKAAIVFENDLETLIISTSFKGDAKDFAWIIPTPSQPQVDKAPYNLFESLEELTQTKENYYPVYSLGAVEDSNSAKQGISILEQKKIDIYDITVLSATNKNALYEWLKDNKYNYPEGGKYILDDYIRNNWVFTAIKISTENMGVAEEQLHEGTANPLKLVFQNDKIVYPLKISSITSSPQNTGAPIYEETPYYQKYYSEYIPVELYIFSDHKKEAIGFNTEWAGWVKADQIKKLGFDENGNPWYDAKDKMYLTKISDSMKISEMKNDVFPINAKNNSRIPPSNFWPIVLVTLIIFMISIFAPTTLLFVIFLLLFIFTKSRMGKIWFIIVQSLLSLMMPIIALIAFSSGPSYYSYDSVSIYGLLYASLAMLVLMITIIIIEIVKLRRNKLNLKS